MKLHRLTALPYITTVLYLLIVWIAPAFAIAAADTQPTLKPAGDEALLKRNIVSIMKKVNDYTYKHPYIADDRNWIRATYYTGVMALYKTTGDEAVLRQAMTWARKHQWEPGTEPFAANCKTCGQTYLELYMIKKDPAMIAKIRAYVDRRMALSEPPCEAWFYCDTLYVGPPTIAMLGHVTGEQKYYDYLHRVYWRVADHLLDKETNLFFRDKRFFTTKSPAGKKILWSRGNGWVIAGIPRVLEHLRKSDPNYDRYVRLLQRMAASLAKVQGDDGLWRPNLADAAHVPGPDSSGTAFFCYAMAWGIRHKILDRAVYLPIVQRAWKGLAGAVGPSGKLGYVQRVDEQPHPATRDETGEYAVGAFLLAGSEMLKLAP